MNSRFKRPFNGKEWCTIKTAQEKRLMTVIFSIGLITIALIIALAVVAHNSKEERRRVCSTPGCIHAASYILKYLDQNADPCEDFYQFACGNFIKETTIPEDKSSVNSFSLISDLVRDQLKLFIEENYDSNNTSKPLQLMKTIYNLCMNTTAIELEGLTSVKSILKELGGWPLLEGEHWNENNFDWKQSVYKFRKWGFSDSLFLYFYIGIDDKNSTRRLITLDQASLGLSREYLIKGFDEKLVKAYYDYMVDIAVIFGANKNSALKELKASLEFEIKLANISLPREERRNSTLLYNPMTVQELQQRYTFIDWKEYINNVLNMPDIKIDYDETVIVAVPKFISDLEQLLNETPKRVQANYAMRRAASSIVFYLTNELRDRELEFDKVISGRSKRQSRWKECTRVATGSVYLATGAGYVKKHFKKEAKMHMEEMVQDIRNEFVKILKKVDWMDEKTRQNALEKVNSMVAYIGYPEELLDEEKVNKYYENLTIFPDSYLKSMKALTMFHIEESYGKLHKPVNKTYWKDHAFPTVVNAFYSSVENSIEFPAGILQGIFFNDDRPTYMNYGGIGYVIGHEITHGFDDEGRQFDKDGNLHDWWAPETESAFIKKAQCIIEQYGNYTVPEVNLTLNGINTQGENVADNGGIKEAYYAYQTWVKRNEQEKQLPGLSYTPNQLFWISAAQTWCTKSRKEILKLQVTLGAHSPSRYRIIGPFGNTKEFGKDFECPLGSNMNPIDKCKVW